jgi:hypothetical protein
MIVQCSQGYRIINDANRTRLIIPGCNKPYSTCVGFGNKLRGLHINAWTNEDNQKDLEYMMLDLFRKTAVHDAVFGSRTWWRDEFEFDSARSTTTTDNDVYFSHYRDDGNQGVGENQGLSKSSE